MRKVIRASEGNWLTQSDTHPFNEVHIFIKSLPVNTPSNWVEWTDAQKTDYEQSHPSGEEAWKIFMSHFNLPVLLKEFGLI